MIHKYVSPMTSTSNTITSHYKFIITYHFIVMFGIISYGVFLIHGVPLSHPISRPHNSRDVLDLARCLGPDSGWGSIHGPCFTFFFQDLMGIDDLMGLNGG